MPSRPKLTALSQHIEANGGEDWVFEFVAEGLSMKKVAEAVGASSRGMLYSWIKAGGEERKQKLKAARRESAHNLAEDGVGILDDLADAQLVTSPEVSLASSRANYRKWLAGVRNREEYGERSALVEISIGDLHLEALARHSAARLPIPEAEYEVIDVGRRKNLSDVLEDEPPALPGELEDLL